MARSSHDSGVCEVSKSVPGLAVFKGGMESKPLKIVEFVDELGLNCHEHHWDIVFKMDIPFHEPLHSSTNGLLFLCKGGLCRCGDLFLCNPITREYIKLPYPRQSYSEPMYQLDNFGFGMSKITGQYKVVRMFLDRKLLFPQFKFERFECQVYTVGTGSWRRIASSNGLWYEEETDGAFLNGNLHFLAHERISSSYRISCIDLETEHFSMFSSPPLDDDPLIFRSLSVLKGCLCVCENSSHKLMSDEINIWLMKEYGDEKSWTKEFVIRRVNRADYLGFICPIKVFKDGSILMELESKKLLYYSSKSKTIRHVNLSGLRGSIISSSTAVYAPSFLPLKTFTMENVVRMSRRKSLNAHNSKMGQDLIPYLPPEIMFNILSRVPARTIMICKCVCKSWLDLLVTPEFVTSHYSNSAPGLATFEHETHSKPYKIIEFVNEVDLNSHEPRWNVVFGFDLPFDEPLHSSANGLLFHKTNDGPGDIFLCNPITREYIKLPCPPLPCWRECYGFGVSRMSGQYKVVRIFRDGQCKYDRFECQVYTVGTGSWRRIACDEQLNFMTGVFLNGNVHWLVRGRSAQVSCLDLETEIFSTFSPPRDDFFNNSTLSVFGDFLCVCDTFHSEWPNCRIDIWLMKVYGDEKSWTKDFVIGNVDIGEILDFLCPIKVFKDGDILMELRKRKLLYYSYKSETTRVIDVSGFDRNISIRTTIYTPTFLSLKTFAMEDVISF